MTFEFHNTWRDNERNFIPLAFAIGYDRDERRLLVEAAFLGFGFEFSIENR